MKYLSAFAAGFDDLVARFLAADFPDARIETMGGAAVIETSQPPSDIRGVKYFKNAFIVAERFLGKTLEEIAACANMKNIRVPARARTFGIVFAEPGGLVRIDGKIKAALIDRISAATYLSYRAGSADTEFQIILRDGARGFLLQRITRAAPPPDAGELDSSTAAIIVRAAEPKPDDVFIDPFCGGGAIPLTRAMIAPYRGIFACDIDVGKLKARLRGIKNSRLQKSFFAKAEDFFANKFDDNFADAIATDPPWGRHQKIDADFYARAMPEFSRILKPGGRLVLLTAREIELPPAAGLSRAETFAVLIHGRKARLDIFIKQ